MKSAVINVVHTAAIHINAHRGDLFFLFNGQINPLPNHCCQ